MVAGAAAGELLVPALQIGEGAARRRALGDPVQRARDRSGAVDARTALARGLGREVDRDADGLGDRARVGRQCHARSAARAPRRARRAPRWRARSRSSSAGAQPRAEVAADEQPRDLAGEAAGGGEERGQRRAALDLVDAGTADRAEQRDERRARLGAGADPRYQSAPWRAISARCASVSTFWISVGPPSHAAIGRARRDERRARRAAVDLGDERGLLAGQEALGGGEQLEADAVDARRAALGRARARG